jgi:hypothetical protein
MRKWGDRCKWPQVVTWRTFNVLDIIGVFKVRKYGSLYASALVCTYMLTNFVNFESPTYLTQIPQL